MYEILERVVFVACVPLWHLHDRALQSENLDATEQRHRGKRQARQEKEKKHNNKNQDKKQRTNKCQTRQWEPLVSMGHTKFEVLVSQLYPSGTRTNFSLDCTPSTSTAPRTAFISFQLPIWVSFPTSFSNPSRSRKLLQSCSEWQQEPNLMPLPSETDAF